MKHFFQITFCILSASIIFNSCRTATEPAMTPGMTAYINGTYWVAESTFAGYDTVGSCRFIFVDGMTQSRYGYDSIVVSLEIPDTLYASQTCASGGNYIMNANPMSQSKGSITLAGKSSSNVAGSFGFQGVVFRSSDTTYITNGEFNVNLAN